MGDKPDDLVLRLLRDIRAEQDAARERGAKRDRKVDDLMELVTQAMGLAAYSNVRTDKFDDRVAEVADRMEALENRVRELRR